MYLGVCCLSRLYSLISNIPKNMKKSYLFYPLGCRTGYTVLKIMLFFSFCLSKKKVHICVSDVHVRVRTYTGLPGGTSGKEHSGTQWKSLSPVWLLATPWTIQSTEFSRPECWNTIQSTEFSRPGYCRGYVAVPFSRGSSQPSDEPRSLTLQADSLPAEPQGKPSGEEPAPRAGDERDSS